MLRGIVLGVACVALVGCNSSDRSICGALTETPEDPTAPANAIVLARSCTEKWAARLARGTDPAEVVARSVMHVCEGSIENTLNHPEIRAKADAVAAAGPSEDMPKIDWKEWEDRALFIALQVRAGDCYKGI